MSEKEDDLAKEIELLRSLENKGTGEKLKTYTKLCGPGWLQSAITLGGGSLIGCLLYTSPSPRDATLYSMPSYA